MNATERPLHDSPYKGLMPYAEEDAAFFFGREAEQDIIAANLQAYRLTLLYGASGVGKSSVLRAGVAHDLRRLSAQSAGERGAREFIVVVFSSWRDDPLAHLIARVRDSIAEASPALSARLPTARPSFADTLAAWTTELDTELLIVLDQFEEYFLYHPDEDGEGTFAVEFPRAISRADLRANFLVSIREDALARLDLFKGRIPNLFDNYLRLEHLDQGAARAAIEKPLERFNDRRPQGVPAVSIEPALVAAVLEQVRTGQVLLGDAGRGGIAADGRSAAAGARVETPYLQLVMTRLWKEERAAGSTALRLQTLNHLGGADRIVRTHLDDVMNALTPSDRRAAARVFRYLVTPSGTKIAHTAADLADYGSLSHAQLERLMERLSSGDLRIVRPIAPAAERPTAVRYEIFHDVLAPAILDWRQRTERTRLTQVQQGLAPIHRAIWLLIPRLFIQNLLIVVPLGLLIVEDPETPSPVLPQWLLLGAAFIGLLFLAAMEGRVRRLSRAVSAAIKLGFRWRTIMDVLADRRGDVAALITGTGMYAQMPPALRDRFRQHRRVEAGATIVAVAVAPPVALYVTVVLGSTGAIGPSTAPLVLLSGSAFFLLYALIFRMWEKSILRNQLRLSSDGTLAAAIDQAPEPFEGVDPDQPLASSLVAATRIGWLLRGVALLLLLIAALPTALIGLNSLLGTILLEIAAFDPMRNQGRIEMGDLGRPFRVPSDPSQSALDAGRAYYAITQAGRPLEHTPQEHPVPLQLDPWLPDLDSNPFGKEWSAAFDALVSRATGRLSDEETRYLERVASNPGFTQSALVARANDVDYLSARFLPQHRMNLFTMPLRAVVWRQVAYAYMAKATLHLSAGRREDAETSLREAASVGVVVMDNAYSLLDLLVGARMVTTALRGLEDFYSLTGQEERARMLRADRDAATARLDDVARPGAAITELDISRIRRTMIDVLGNSRGRRGERWDALQFMAFAPCTNPRELIFGPTPRLQQAFDRARADLVRFPSEARLFDNVLATLNPARADVVDENDPAGSRMFRWIGWAFGNTRIPSCMAVNSQFT